MEATAAMKEEAVAAQAVPARGRDGHLVHVRPALKQATGEGKGTTLAGSEKDTAQLVESLVESPVRDVREGTGSDDGVGVGVNRLGLSEIGSVFDGDDGSDDWLAAAAVAEVAQEKVTKYIIFSVATYIH